MTGDKKWYVVHTYSGMEKSAETALRDRIKRAGLEDAFDEILVPTEDVSEVKDGKNVCLHVVCTPDTYLLTC